MLCRQSFGRVREIDGFNCSSTIQSQKQSLDFLVNTYYTVRPFRIISVEKPGKLQVNNQFEKKKNTLRMLQKSLNFTQKD